MSGTTDVVHLVEREGALLFTVPPGWVALSSAAVGGGLVRPRLVANLTVDEAFGRTDLDAYVAERLAALGRDEAPVTALLTAADVRCWTGAESDGARAWATVAASKPTWAARPGGPDVRPDDDVPPEPGTVNIVVALPVPLTPSALVQAVGTVTEAKAQALLHAGVPGTGTASDAVVVLCPDPSGVADPVPFAGVRSAWGNRLAQAVRRSVGTGMLLNPWPQVAADAERLW